MYTQSTTWLYLVLFLFIHFIQASTALSTQEEQSVACRLTPCLCCRNHTCSVPGQLKYTCNGCIDGFTGSDCLEPCPPTCVTCSQSFYDKGGSGRICDQCQGGFYNGYYRDNTDVGFFQRDCSLTCKPGCDKCSSYSYCAKCKTGYFLSYDNSCEECPMFCAECETAHGCSKCYDGYFWNGISCDFCKQFCKTCKSYDSCDECEEGFYLSGGNCLDCSEGCTSCLTSSSCIKCRKGFYLTYGKCEKCTENCDSCSGDDLGGYKCEKCRFGYYNSRNICKKCIDGCALCLSDEICVECINGYKLFHGLCFKCPFRCKVCSADSYCSECNSGFFHESGKCITCPENCASCSSKETCTRCKSGYHGDTCTLPCYEHCSNDNCNKTTGECISCRDGYYFKETGQLNKECTRCAPHCKVCTNDADCFACDDGYKGEMCNEECEKCLNGTRCDRYVGYCFVGCRDGLCGENCDMNCDSKCLSCDRSNPGRCNACSYDRYGIGCMQHCLETCKDKSCSDDDGICTKGCLPGFWGGACLQTCKGYCKDNLCDRFDGSCSDGCSENYKGGLCLCPKNCNCDSQGNCISCNKTFGTVCNESCSIGCMDGVCDRNSGVCSNGCKEGFNGSHCDKITFEERPSGLSAIVILVVICSAVILVVVTVIIIYKRLRASKYYRCFLSRDKRVAEKREIIKDRQNISEEYPTVETQPLFSMRTNTDTEQRFQADIPKVIVKNTGIIFQDHKHHNSLWNVNERETNVDDTTPDMRQEDAAIESLQNEDSLFEDAISDTGSNVSSVQKETKETPDTRCPRKDSNHDTHFNANRRETDVDKFVTDTQHDLSVEQSLASAESGYFSSRSTANQGNNNGIHLSRSNSRVTMLDDDGRETDVDDTMSDTQQDHIAKQSLAKKMELKEYVSLDKLKDRVANMSREDFEQEFQALRKRLTTYRENEPTIEQIKPVKYVQGELRNYCSLYIAPKDADVAELRSGIFKTVWVQKIKTVVILDGGLHSEVFGDLPKTGFPVDDGFTVKLECSRNEEYFNVLQYNFKKAGWEEEQRVNFCVLTLATDIWLSGKTMYPVCEFVVKLQHVVTNFTTIPLLLIIRVTNREDTADLSLGGIFVVVDNLLKLGDKTNVSIPMCVLHFLKKHPYLIQTSEQYESIYRAFLLCNASMETNRDLHAAEL